MSGRRDVNALTTELAVPERATLIAASSPNSITAIWRPYIYRGTGEDTLTPDLDAPRHNDKPIGHVPKPCGTPAAYRRHLRRGETPCESCKRAESARHADWKAARGAA